jgi:CelD/BcsL family acetyltransferase involved in cellulose biosynthesis
MGGLLADADATRPGAVRPEPVLTEVLTDIRSIERLHADQWDALVEALPRPSPCLLHGWVTARLRHSAGLIDAQVHVAWRRGRLVGVLPLEVSRRRGVRVAGFAGGPGATWTDVMLAAGEPDETARRLIESATHSGHDLCHFPALARDSRVGELAPLVLVKRFDNALVDFDGGWENAYRSKVSKRHRQDHRRKRRLLRELGRVETSVARAPHELAGVLDETFRLHELRWSGRYDGSGYAEPVSRRAMHDAVVRLGARDGYRIVTLELDRRPIAFLSFFVISRTAVGHRTAFDPAFGAYSPGALVFFDAFAACEAEGVTRFEFGGGDDRYKRSLADVMEPLYDGVGLARGIRGRLASAGLERSLQLGQWMRGSNRGRTAYRRARDLLHAR